MLKQRFCKFFLEVFEEELFARKSLKTIDGSKNNDSSECSFYTAQTLLNAYLLEKNKEYNSLKQYLCCDGKNCMSTLCKNITNIESSGNLLKANSRYFLCLSKGHLKE